MPTLNVSMSYIDRSFDPTLNPPGSARILQNVDTTWLDGRIRMGLGPARTDFANEDAGYSVTSCQRLDRPDGAFMMITGNDRGEVDVYFALAGVGCAGSPVTNDLIADFFSTTDLIAENFEEDGSDIDVIENEGGY